MKIGLFIAAMIASSLAVSAQTTANTAPATDATAAASGGEVMPLIVIEDAPLQDAIRNLARQANLNILFDPRVFQATMGPDGKTPQPPPNVSFRLENVTARQALQALLENHNLQMTEDPRTKIARVTVKEPGTLEPLIPRVIALKYYSQPTNMIPMIKANFATPRSQVFVDARTGQLVILGTQRELEQIEQTVAKLDIAPGQILIEARFIRTQRNPQTKKGVDWRKTLEDHTVKFGNVSTFTLEPKAPTKTEPFFPGLLSGQLGGPSPLILSTAGDAFGSVGFLNTEGLNAVISFINTDSDTETIATPRAVALEGVPTELADIENVPILEEQQGGSTGATQQPNTVKPNYEVKVGDTIINEVGTKLIVTPRIYGSTNVFLDLKPEISSQNRIFKQVLSDRESQGLVFARRRITTSAMVPNGMTLVLGGLSQDENTKNKTKVPILGDLPGIGRAFRSDTKSRLKTELLMFVTPTILSGEDYVASPEARDFLHQKPIDKPSSEWAPWDSSDPKDWTSPSGYQE